jgi:beta-N-acetylhexosaminidase
MKGADIGNLKTRAERALKAGCDMLIVCHQPRELLLELMRCPHYRIQKTNGPFF